MKKFLYKLMGYKFIYHLMPKWTKFIYCFDVMVKNKSGSLHLDNGYALNFETMMIEKEEIKMTGQEIITYCSDCRHCFKSRRSKTGYACEVWGYDDFACDTELSGFCHKAKPKYNSKGATFTLSDLERISKGEQT